MASSQTSSFWLCPVCSKHVPTRQTSCKCGFDRAAEKAAVPIVGPQPALASRPQFQEAPEREPTPWKAIATVCVGAIVLAGAFKVSMDAGRQPDPKPSQGAAVLRQQPDTPIGPQAYFLPMTGQQPGTQPNPRVLTAAEQVEMAARQVQKQREAAERQPRPLQDMPEFRQQQQPQAVAAPTSVPEEQTEQYWRKRTHEVQELLRSTALRCVSHLATGAVGVGDVSTSAFAEVRGQYLTALSTYDALLEDARRAGALNSWVRLEFDARRNIKGWFGESNRCR